MHKWITGKQRLFNSGWHPAHPRLFLKKEIYEKFRSFNLNSKFAANFYLMLRVFEKFNISSFYLPQTLVKLRLGGVSNRSFKNIFNHNLEYIDAFEVNGIRVNKILYPLYKLIPKFLQF